MEMHVLPQGPPRPTGATYIPKLGQANLLADKYVLMNGKIQTFPPGANTVEWEHDNFFATIAAQGLNPEYTVEQGSMLPSDTMDTASKVQNLADAQVMMIRNDPVFRQLLQDRMNVQLEIRRVESELGYNVTDQDRLIDNIQAAMNGDEGAAGALEAIEEELGYQEAPLDPDRVPDGVGQYQRVPRMDDPSRFSDTQERRVRRPRRPGRSQTFNVPFLAPEPATPAPQPRPEPPRTTGAPESSPRVLTREQYMVAMASAKKILKDVSNATEEEQRDFENRLEGMSPTQVYATRRGLDSIKKQNKKITYDEANQLVDMAANAYPIRRDLGFGGSYNSQADVVKDAGIQANSLRPYLVWLYRKDQEILAKMTQRQTLLYQTDPVLINFKRSQMRIQEQAANVHRSQLYPEMDRSFAPAVYS